MRPQRRLVLVPPAPRSRERGVAVKASALALLAWAGIVALGLLVAPLAYWLGYTAGQREADENAVYGAVGDALRLGSQVAALSDSLHRDRAKLDSLARARWQPAKHDTFPRRLP